MANTLYFRVFSGASEVALGDPVQEDTVDFSGGVNSSAVISTDNPGIDNKRMRVRLFADDDCFVTWGANPTAQNDGSDGMPMGAENPEYVDIEAGHKISVIARV